MTIKCIAVDDEPLALKQISAYIQKTPFLELIGEYLSAFEVMNVIKTEKINLIFIDINMPDLNGMDFVKSLQNKPAIVFTTAYSEYAVEGFKVDAIDYLLKPISYADFLKAANKVKSSLELYNNKSDINDADYIFVKSDYKIVKIELSKIKYIESMHEYVKFHIENHKPVLTHKSMKEIEEQLSNNKFMRVHRSFIVNLEKVQIVEKNRIIFDQKITIPITEQYKLKFQNFLNGKSI